MSHPVGTTLRHPDGTTFVVNGTFLSEGTPMYLLLPCDGAAATSWAVAYTDRVCAMVA